jgi:hypothetical protein
VLQCEELVEQKEVKLHIGNNTTAPSNTISFPQMRGKHTSSRVRR